LLKDKLEKYQNRIKKSPKHDGENQSPSGAATPDDTDGPKRTAKDKPKGDRVKERKAGKGKTPREGGRKKRHKSPKESGPTSIPPTK